MVDHRQTTKENAAAYLEFAEACERRGFEKGIGAAASKIDQTMCGAIEKEIVVRSIQSLRWEP